MYWTLLALMSVPGCRSATPPGEPPAAEDSAPAGSADTGEDCSAPPIDGLDPDAAPAFTLDPPPRNLLILSVDTLRRDALGSYGAVGVRPPSPAIDALLASGLSLGDHRSCSDWTLPSMLCLLTGRGFLESTWAQPLGDRLLAEGFQVGVISANTWLHAAWPSRDDYDIYDIDLYEGPEVIEKTLAAVRDFQAGGGPWFLQSHFIDAHAPYSPDASYLEGIDALPPIPYDLGDWWDLSLIEDGWEEMSPELRANIRSHLRFRYAAGVREQDDFVAELLAGLEELGALEDTLLVFLSDHGEQLYARSEMRHGARLYQEESAAVAAFVAPGISPGVWEGPTTHADIEPTILYALGLPPDDGAEGLIVGTARPDRPRFAHVVMDYVRQTVDIGSLRLHLDWDGPVALYDLAEDPGEVSDIWDPSDPAQRLLWDTLMPRAEALDCLVAEDSLGWP